MDPSGVDRVALLSIKPAYAEAIFDGRKTVEFRRSRLASDIELAIVYATQPVGRIVGSFRVAKVAESTPDALWRHFGRVGAISRREYFAYFEGADRAFGIEIAEPIAVTEPLLLGSLSPRLRAPQSFQYVSAVIAAPFVTRHKRTRTPLAIPRTAFA